MIMRKETLVFLTSLAIIFIIGYVNMTMTPENVFNEKDYAQFQDELNAEAMNNDKAQIVEDETKNIHGAELVEILEQTDKTDIAVNAPADVAEDIQGGGKGSEDIAEAEDTKDVAETPDTVNTAEKPQETASPENEAAIAQAQDDGLDYVILGDITNISSKDSVVASSNGVLDMINSSFANFKLNKEKSNQDVVDHLEKSLSNETISAETKSQFEGLLLNKNEFINTEKNIELMLQSKGYNETVVIVDKDMVKVVTNDTIEQADATKILDVIVTETHYEPSQIKIVKFDNIDL